jgi:hypothetical protein
MQQNAAVNPEIPIILNRKKFNLLKTLVEAQNGGCVV